MNKRVSTIFFSFLLVLGILAVPSPAAAELGDNNNLPWGVDGTNLPDNSARIRTEVWAIEQIADRIFLGGRFQEVTDGQVSIGQPFLAAFDAGTGQYISSFTPQLDDVVHALAASPDGSRLFVGGNFTSVNGQAIDAIVALDPITGAIDSSWTGDLNGAPSVRSMTVLGDWLYVSGSFGAVVSSTGNNAAKGAIRFDVTTGGHDADWRPILTGGAVWGIAPSPDLDRVYMAGYFEEVNGQPVVGGFAAVSSIDGSLVQGVQDININTTSSSRQYLYDVVVVNGYVWIAGSEHFVQVLNESDLSLHRFHLADPRGDYQDLEVVGDRVYAGCHCRNSATMQSAEGVIWFRNPPPGEQSAPLIAEGPTSWVAAFDAITGEWIPTFVPDIEAARAGVWAIHGDSNGCVWFGGDLTFAGTDSVDSVIRLCEDGSLDTEVPSIPGPVQVGAIGADSVDLSWAASTDNVGVTGYQIFDSSTNFIVGSTSTNSVTLTGLAPGDYSVYVKSFDAAGNQSSRTSFRSFTVTGVAIDDQRPSVPGAIQVVSVGADSVELAWNESTDNVGVAGYRLYEAGTNNLVVEVPTNSATLTGLAAGSYSLYVRAFDAVGNVSYRTGFRNFTVTGAVPDTERPRVTSGLMVDAVGVDSITMSWTPATDNVGVTGYRIYDADTNAQLIQVTDTTVTFDSLAAGTYRFYARAEDAAGNLSYRTGIRTVVVVGSTDTQRPSVPGAIVVDSVVGETVALSWGPATDNVGVVGYRVFNFDGRAILSETSAPSAAFDLPAGTYQVFVKAFDAAGNESYRTGLRTVVTPG